jgi:signal transduction histidine kinase
MGLSSVAGMTPDTLAAGVATRQRTMSAIGSDSCHQSLTAAPRAGIVRAVTKRIPQLAGRVVLLLSALLAVVEVGRVGLAGETGKTLVAIAAVAVFMPLHLWHLSYGVRGERPPHSGPTLAVIAVVNVAALAAIGVSWSFMLAVLATSALVVLRPPWSLAVLGACVVAPVVVSWAEPGSGVGFSSSAAYLMYSVLFRAAIQFAMVWLVAAVHQLAASRTALAADAVLEERARLQLEVRGSLERHLVGLRDAGRRARAALAMPGMAQPLVALDGVLSQANDALRDLRTIVTETRAARSETAAAALVRTVRAGRSPIGRGLATRQAWWTLASVHALVLLFPLLMCVGAFGFDSARDPALAVLAWVLLTALTVSTSLAVARGRPPSYPVARVVAAAALAFGLIWVFGIVWETSAWFVAIAAVTCLRGRPRVAIVLLAPLSMLAYDTVTWVDTDDPSTYALVWNVAYWLTVSSLVVAGVCASARLVRIVAELDAARDALAANAVRSERRRLSRDLHDVLGQSLTAISLKADLARRLIGADRAAAAREIGELEAVASSLAEEIEAVARDEREVAFVTEAGAAVDLLRLAGIDVTASLDVDGIAPDASAVLGFAMREGATNILRHADARTCTIHATRENGVVRLELVNDGAGLGRTEGTGLQNLADRLSDLDGRVAGAALGGGRFRLRVEVPA